MTDLVLVLGGGSYVELELRAAAMMALAAREIEEAGYVPWDVPAPILALKPPEPDPPCALFKDFWR